MKKILAVSLCLCVISSVVSADTFGTGANQFMIDFVTISGDASSVNGTNISQYSPDQSAYKTFSDPSKDYRMGTYEITNGQWNKFMAAYGTVTGNPSTAYNDNVPYWPDDDVPANKVSWYEAAQFVNYLNTSTGHQAAYKFTGTKGTSNYTLEVWGAEDADGTNIYRNKNAHYFLPTENEWVKAAYWNGTTLQTYANASAGDLVGGWPDPAKWNYSPSVGSEPWNATSGVQELNGTHNMMGNVREWMESPFSTGDYLSGSFRGLRGGSYNYYVYYLASSYRLILNPINEDRYVGFRVASIVPEPCSLALLFLGGLALRYRKR